MPINIIKTYADEDGKVVEEFILVDIVTRNPIDNESSSWFGKIKIGMPGARPDRTPLLTPDGEPLFIQHHDVHFPIDANNLSDAFENHQAAFEKFMNEQTKIMEEEEEEDKIILPSISDVEEVNSTVNRIIT